MVRPFDFGEIQKGSWAWNDLWGILNGGYHHEKMPKDPKTIVDVGANIGAFTVWAAKHFPDAQVRAFEPHPGAFKLLQKNTEGLLNVTLFPYAVSNVQGTGVLYTGQYTFGESSFHDIGQQTKDAHPVPKRRLDDMMNAPDILKIDTEGHELQVLEGCSFWPGGFDDVQFLAIEIHRREDEEPVNRELGRYGLLPVERQVDAPDRIVVRYARTT